MRYLYLLATIVDTSGLPNHTPHNTIDKVLTTVFGITASIALLMIIIGGFRYVIAKGDPQDMAGARDTIIYAIVGLLVTLIAYSVVTFVIRGIG